MLQYINKMNNCFKFLKISAMLLFILPIQLISQSNILKSGKWIQLEFPNNGVYKITPNDLVAFGLDLSQINPKKLHFYAIQGPQLSLLNGPVENSCTEIPIYIQGESDGVLDPTDFILLYKQTSKDILVRNGDLKHFNNFYSNKSYGIFGYNDTNGLRIQTQITPNVLEGHQVKKSQNVIFHDSDMVNPTTMGNYWVGEKLGNETLERTFVENIPASADSISVKLSFGISMYDDTGSLFVTVNGKSKLINLRQNNPDNEAVYDLTFDMNVPKVPNNEVRITSKLNRNNSKSGAYLNFYRIVYFDNIALSKSQFSIINQDLWRNDSSKRIFLGTEDANYKFLDVTNEYMPQFVNAYSVSGQMYIGLGDTQTISRLYAFNINQTFKPKFVSSIQNQAILEDDVEMVILTHPAFIDAANDLANFRRNNNQLSVKVLTPQLVYNEFSGAQQDLMAFRKYLRALHSKYDGKLKYVLLMGAASFDMQNRVSNNTNFIPIYHSQGYFKTQVFCLDDVIGYFELGKGDPELTNSNKLGVSIGRIPCRTLSEAQGVVNKIKAYESPKSLGAWRNKITFITDDIDKDHSWETIFTNQSETYARNILSAYPNLRLNKVYADAFTQVTNGNNQKYPGVSAAINSAMSEGTLMMNYQGHGGEKGWAQEQFLDIPMINAWKNIQNMPILFTATCEFSRFDDPNFQSAGELTLLNPNGGAIALMTTTRLVFVSGNSDINNAFWTKYGFPKPNEPMPTLGEMYTKLKNRPKTQYESEDTKFALLGDPSMKLAFPKHLIQIDSVNGESSSNFTDTIGAFSVVKLKGHINERLKGIMSDFNGVLDVEIYDKPSVKYTINNDKTGGELPFLAENGIIYKGSVSVQNGQFSVLFTVPKDIAYNFGEGRAIFYAQNGVTDASGSWKFMIGGSENIKEVDSVGPEVYAYINDTTFKSKGKVCKNSKFVGRVFDKSGINATGSGIGRDLEIILDPETANEQSFVVNQYFTYDKNSYQRGTIEFPLESLSPGKHVIRCNAWDIYNNSGRGYVEFEVVPGRVFEVTENGVKPNPSTDGGEISFWVNHNLGGEDIEVDWKIYQSTGVEIASGKRTEMASTSVFNALEWNGMTNVHAQSNNQIYFYKIQLTTTDGLSKIVSGKFIKLR